MQNKTKAILSIIFGIIGFIILPIIFGPLAIYLGIKAKKEGFKKLGNIGITIGIIVLILMFFAPIISRFIIVPTLGLILNTSQPISTVNSQSMSHKESIDNWWESHEFIYQKYNITKEQFKSFPYKNGINLGDVLITKGTNYDKLNVGDVIIFKNFKEYPTSHRIIKKYQKDGINYITTKGDNNLGIGEYELSIKEEQIIGKISGVIPKIGLQKIYLHKLIN
jgi:hypothetical protein